MSEGLTQPLRAIAEMGRKPSLLLGVAVFALSLIAVGTVAWLLIFSGRVVESALRTQETMADIIRMHQEQVCVQLGRLREEKKANPF